MVKKFELVKSDKITLGGKPLFQVRALMDFSFVKKGELGGYIEKEANLAQDGVAWVSGNALVYGDAEVSGDAWVSGNAWVSGDARVSGNAWVYGDAWVSGDAWVYGNAKVNVVVCSRFNFSTQAELDLWLEKEKEFECEVKKLKEK